MLGGHNVAIRLKAFQKNYYVCKISQQISILVVVNMVRLISSSLVRGTAIHLSSH